MVGVVKLPRDTILVVWSQARLVVKCPSFHIGDYASWEIPYNISHLRNVHPGYSMHEWNVLCQSGQDLTGGRGGHSKVTLEELEKHCTEKDAWTAVRGITSC